ncbi:(d)CMP kinase [Croceibacter atlanticus]|jgi:cytidylate kinase|uniref:Cytidylate kinase n=1 Tax=Croceibacter atlanticus (strain ATCC BAA-628 / JCM 21780 / CIP 108009 / IAM 15332 / KCTC 12090 / HTCC2559) TaxID=216432 RepID=A3U9E1_CROAH|nr:(d)CMP kinase [Croceibacter atlanticus]EAP86427.1 putative cytidylate kinase [Croceibacter atlanticus HTCC2559]MBW4971096.1 (d)CMP kinase [Croceibacter atlanticus]
MQKKITIAIDGYSSTGKSTVAKQLASHLNYIYVDTGAMYRAVTLYALNNNIISETVFNKEKLINELDNIEITFKYNETKGFAEVLLNSINVEHQIRTLKVSNFVSPIATVSEIRKKLVSQQQRLGKDKGVVMDGRDIGTVVFPDADLKLFMTASAEERAQRRYKELIERGDAVNYEDIYNNVVERDLIDTTRKDSPLVKAKDAIEIDNSQLTLDGQFHTILQLVKDKLAGRS